MLIKQVTSYFFASLLFSPFFSYCSSNHCDSDSCHICYPIIHFLIIHFAIILFFQYCDSNIDISSIAHCKVIPSNILCFIFVIISLLLFSIALSKVIALSTNAMAIVVALISFLEAIAKRFQLYLLLSPLRA